MTFFDITMIAFVAYIAISIAIVLMVLTVKLAFYSINLLEEGVDKLMQQLRRRIE